MLKGIPVIITSEAYTSITCHICGCEGKRRTQGLFIYPHCGEYNADLNGAVNIAREGLRLYASVRGCREPALNQHMLEAHVL